MFSQYASSFYHFVKNTTVELIPPVIPSHPCNNTVGATGPNACRSDGIGPEIVLGFLAAAGVVAGCCYLCYRRRQANLQNVELTRLLP